MSEVHYTCNLNDTHTHLTQLFIWLAPELIGNCGESTKGLMNVREVVSLVRTL